MYSVAVSQRTDTVMTKRKRQATIDKTLSRKLKIEQHELWYKLRCSRRISRSQGRIQDLGLGGGGVSRRRIWGPLKVPSGSRA